MGCKSNGIIVCLFFSKFVFFVDKKFGFCKLSFECKMVNGFIFIDFIVF